MGLVGRTHGGAVAIGDADAGMARSVGVRVGRLPWTGTAMLHALVEGSSVFTLEVGVDGGRSGSRLRIRGGLVVWGGCAVRVDVVVGRLSGWESHRGAGQAMRAVGRRGDAGPGVRQVADVGGWKGG